MLALAVAAWAARQGATVLGPLGFAVGRTPCQSTLPRLFARLDGDVLSGALSAHADQPHADVALVVGANHARA